MSWSRLLIVSLLAALVAVGCGGFEARESGSAKDSPEAGSKAEDSAVPVQVAALERGAIEAVLGFSANLEAEKIVEVRAEAARKVEAMLVEEGSVVGRGQVLLRLQDEEQRTTLAKVESELRKVRREYERQTRLHEQGFLSEEDWSTATYEIEQLELRHEEAKRELSYTELRAPIAGTVTRRLVNLGDFVTLNQPLFELVDFGSIVARVFVPEKELANVSPGQEARISAPSLGAELYAGKIDRIAPVVDPKSGTVKVTVALSRHEGLRPGLYVDVQLVVATRPDALLIPKRALVYDQDQVFVYRLEDGDKVERVRLEPRLEDKSFVEPAAGFAAGDRLVVAGQAGLKDGARVRLVGELAGGLEGVAAR